MLGWFFSCGIIHIVSYNQVYNYVICWTGAYSSSLLPLQVIPLQLWLPLSSRVHTQSWEERTVRQDARILWLTVHSVNAIYIIYHPGAYCPIMQPGFYSLKDWCQKPMISTYIGIRMKTCSNGWMRVDYMQKFCKTLCKTICKKNQFWMVGFGFLFIWISFENSAPCGTDNTKTCVHN